MKELVVIGMAASISMIIVFFSLHPAISRPIIRRFIERPTQQALDSILGNIVSAKNESDNCPEKLALAVTTMKTISWNSLEDFLKPCTFRFKVAFMIFCHHYNLTVKGETEQDNHVGLHDLKIFLLSPERVSDSKIVEIFECAAKGALWLAIEQKGFLACGQPVNEFGNLFYRIRRIKDSPYPRQALRENVRLD
jgi:hypothetical protein